MLFDLGPHLVDQALALFGAPDAITASVRADRDQTAIEDAFDITLHYKTANGKGLLAHCRTSYLACDNAPRFLLHGTQGSFRKHGLDPQEPALDSGSKVPATRLPRSLAHRRSIRAGEPSPSPPTPPIRPSSSATRSKPNPATTAASTPTSATRFWAPPPSPSPREDGYRVIRLLELARESSTQARTLRSTSKQAQDRPVLSPGNSRLKAKSRFSAYDLPSAQTASHSRSK